MALSEISAGFASVGDSPELRELQRKVDGVVASLNERLREVEARLAALEAYAPGSGASWASPAPSTVSEALDRLSAAAATDHGAAP